MQLLKSRRRLDPELLDERPARVLVRLERLGLPSAAVERKHQLSARPLPERVLAHDRLELADELGGTAELELGLDSLLDRSQPQLL